MMTIPRRPVRDYVLTINRYNSQNHAFTSISLFLEFVYNWRRVGVRLTDSDKEHYEFLAQKYLSEERDHQKDVTRYLQQLNGRSNSAYTRLSILGSWLHEYDININKADIKRKLPKRWTKTNSPELNMGIIRRLLAHSDELMKAIIFVNLSGGLRIGETLRLKYDDITPVPETNIYKVRIDGDMTKTGRERITFITQEAMDAVNEYLLVRTKIFASKNHVGIFNKEFNTELLFPLCRSSVTTRFARILKRADLYEMDKTTKKLTIHIHLLRHMFYSNLVASGVPIGIVEHFIHYTGSKYAHFTTKQLSEAYMRGMSSLIVGVDEDTKRKNELLLDTNAKLLEENKYMKNTNESLNKQVVQAMELLLPLLKLNNK